MRLARILTGAAVMAAAATMLGVVAPASADTGTNYAALGDSYSAGVGTDNYYSSSGSCDRSPQGYPALWSAAHSVSSFQFVACSGAKTSDVINNQLGALSSSTNLVSLTIGGNDAGFSSVMETCILQGDSGCQTAVANAENYARNTLPGLLDTTYGDIQQHAPNAQVVVLGYPEFYTIGGSCIVGLSDTSRGYIDEGADVIDGVIAQEVAKFGNFSFVDVRSIFQPHEICSGNTEWLNSLTWPISDSYHPTADGYSGGYLPSLESVTG